MDDPDEIGGLIGSIYEAGVDHTLWPAFMASLARRLNAGVGNLWLHDFSAGSVAFVGDGYDVSVSTGLDQETVAQYKNYYAARNVWLPNASQLAEGAVAVSSALYPDHLLKRTEFYGGFLRQQDLFYAVGGSVVKEGARDVKMSFVRSEGAGRYSDIELHLVRRLIPHVRNAVVLHRELYRSKAMAASAVAALELVPVGVVLLTGSGRLMQANRRAHDLFARTQAVRFDAAGTLQAARTAATTALQRLIHDAIQASSGKGLAHGGALQLAGPGGRKLKLLVTPLPAGSASFDGGAMAAIFCSDPEAIIGVLSQRLEVMYGMTPAEAQLTEALINGQSLTQYADARSKTLNTVRTQLKAVMAKTGAKRQSDLVRIVLTGPAIFNQDAQT